MRGTHGVSLRGAMAGGQDQGWPYVLLGGSGVGVRAGRYKLTWSPRESNLFDLKMDPKERVNLGGRRPVARRTCEVYLGESLAVPNKRRRLDGMDARQKKSGKKVVLDERLQQQLKALGYIE